MRVFWMKPYDPQDSLIKNLLLASTVLNRPVAAIVSIGSLEDLRQHTELPKYVRKVPRVAIPQS